MWRNILLGPSSVGSHIMKTIPVRGLEKACWQSSEGESENGAPGGAGAEHNNDDLVQYLRSMKQ